MSSTAAKKKGAAGTKKKVLGEELLKIIMVGECGVGKSSLIARLVDSAFSEEPVVSLGMDFKLKTVSAGGKTLKLQIWDTAGQERFSMVTNSYYRGAQGVVLVYDIADKESFRALDRWLDELDTYTPKETNRILIGNKTDLGVKRAVATSVASEFAEARGIPFYETSAKSGENVDKVFISLAQAIFERTGEGAVPSTSDGIKLGGKHDKPAGKKGCSI